MNSDMSETKRRIVDVVSGVFRLPAQVVREGVSPDSVEGWDSEKHVELVVALEETFGCMFEAEEVPELTSIDGMEAVLHRHGY